MNQLICALSMISAWSMSVIYYFIELKTGREITLLLGAAILTMIIGLYVSYRKGKETEEEIH